MIISCLWSVTCDVCIYVYMLRSCCAMCGICVQILMDSAAIPIFRLITKYWCLKSSVVVDRVYFTVDFTSRISFVPKNALAIQEVLSHSTDIIQASFYR